MPRSWVQSPVAPLWKMKNLLATIVLTGLNKLVTGVKSQPCLQKKLNTLRL